MGNALFWYLPFSPSLSISSSLKAFPRFYQDWVFHFGNVRSWFWKYGCRIYFEPICLLFDWLIFLKRYFYFIKLIQGLNRSFYSLTVKKERNEIYWKCLVWISELIKTNINSTKWLLEFWVCCDVVRSV